MTSRAARRRRRQPLPLTRDVTLAAPAVPSVDFDARSDSGCSGCSDCAGLSDSHGCYGVGSFNEHPVQFIDGTWCEPLEHLIGMQSLMGLRSGLLLDTQIVAHGAGEGPEVYVEVHAQEGCRIGQLDVERALRGIPTDAFDPARSYYWEGLTINRSENTASIQWGS